MAQRKGSCGEELSGASCTAKRRQVIKKQHEWTHAVFSVIIFINEVFNQ